jgi:phosphoglycerate dehydrogenase-like enzyme
MSIIYISDKPENISLAYTPEQLADHPVLTWYEYKQNPLPDTKIIFSTWGMPALDEQEIGQYFPSLEMLFYAAGSVQAFARPFLHRGIRVFSAWGANAIPVAEFTVSQIVLANKGYFQLHRRYQQDGHAKAFQYAETFPGNFGSKVGILGAGMIGKKVIELLKPHNLEILVFDPFINPEQADILGVRPASLKEIFTSCQCISNHLANNSQTRGMLGYPQFSLMKDNATFINTGRGAQVISNDLAKAMAEEPGRTALLDVTDPDEPLPANHIFWSCPNIYVTPHRAGSITDEKRRMGVFMHDELNRLLASQEPLWEVTADMLGTMA